MNSDQPSAKSPQDVPARNTILITHANPEDNAITTWLAARLSSAGYRVWVDLSELRGGTDFWSEIDYQLRNRAAKQIVLISEHISKPGVQKELAIGDIVGKQLGDPGFMIPVRISNVSFAAFPPELVRRNAHNAYPHWADALIPLFKDLKEAQVPKQEFPDASFIEQLITAREEGRKIVEQKPEVLLSNWFELDDNRPEMHLFALRCPDSQKKRWLKSLDVPFIEHGNLIGTFSDPVSFREAGVSSITIEKRFSISFDDLVDGRNISPFRERADSRRAVVNLMRQHWDNAMARKGLVSFEFANRRLGWFFPDGLIDGAVKIDLESGTRVNRVLSGKFKERRWHLCLVAKPQLFPRPLFRVHANVALSEDGRTPLPGKKTQKIRRRLTKSWWNDKWRDMLLASMAWLANPKTRLIDISGGAETFQINSFPLSAETPLSYRDDRHQVLEENDDGEIRLSEEVGAEPADETVDGTLNS